MSSRPSETDLVPHNDSPLLVFDRIGGVCRQIVTGSLILKNTLSLKDYSYTVGLVFRILLNIMRINFEFTDIFAWHISCFIYFDIYMLNTSQSKQNNFLLDIVSS